ncbi:MAG: hypothetical protein KDC80_15365 [Saprospiraceae bacterium]|nr:hypothetical protein [Saprospiraceae bacterium]
MSLLFESIKIIDGVIQNLDYHQRRVDRSLLQVSESSKPWILKDIIVPSQSMQGINKCRFTYNCQYSEYVIEPYHPRIIERLHMVEANSLDYSLKWKDRSQIENLIKNVNEHEEVVIVKNGLVTDASYANLAFFDSKHWYTPHTPLLPGTKRQKLIDDKLLLPAVITPDDMPRYYKVSLINAMLELGEVEIAIENVYR